MQRLLSIEALSMRYPNGHLALDGVDLAVNAGECVVILGSNGCGKSTMLKCIVRTVNPTSGRIVVDGNDLAGLGGGALRSARRAVALVAQNANLVRRRSALANVATGALGAYRNWKTSLGMLPGGELHAAMAHLQTVGLASVAPQRAGTLSGGQAQRVAIARGLAQRPKVLLADEPVASLDPEAAEDVLCLLRRLAHDDGLAVVCVLHQPDLALRHADRIVGLRRGRVAFDVATRECTSDRIASVYSGDVAA